MEENTIGAVRLLKMNIEHPLKIEGEFEYRQLQIITGVNASGKTFLLKLTWAASLFMTLKLQAASDRPDEVKLQYILDNTFENNDLKGEVEVVYERASAKFELHEGGVTSLEVSIDENVTHAGGGMPIFMSAKLRTFDNMKTYLALSNLTNIEHVLKTYRLYDVIYMQVMAHRFNKPHPIQLSESVRETLRGFELFKSDIHAIRMTDETFLITEDEGGEEKDAAVVLSAGEQSILNMVIGSQLQRPTGFTPPE